MIEVPQRRSLDHWLGWLARFWDWIDTRDIDKHVVSVVVLFFTWRLTEWFMHFSETCTKPGLETAAIIAAVSAPWAALQTKVIEYYFKARQ